MVVLCLIILISHYPILFVLFFFIFVDIINEAKYCVGRKQEEAGLSRGEQGGVGLGN
jgi:hypothetical protein